jgi:hypothetical protein
MLTLAVIQHPLDQRRELFLHIVGAPAVEVDAVVGETRVATVETGHLQQSLRPQPRIARTLLAYGACKGQAMGEIEPADIAGYRNVNLVLL